MGDFLSRPSCLHPGQVARGHTRGAGSCNFLAAAALGAGTSVQQVPLWMQPCQCCENSTLPRCGVWASSVCRDLPTLSCPQGPDRWLIPSPSSQPRKVKHTPGLHSWTLSTCHHTPLHATTCHHMPTRATTRHHVPPHATMCHHTPVSRVIIHICGHAAIIRILGKSA